MRAGEQLCPLVPGGALTLRCSNQNKGPAANSEATPDCPLGEPDNHLPPLAALGREQDFCVRGGHRLQDGLWAERRDGEATAITGSVSIFLGRWMTPGPQSG